VRGLLAGAAAAGGQVSGPQEAPEWVTSEVQAPGLRHRTFNSVAVGAAVSYHIYTPEIYDTESERRFPVLYWLHGSGGGLGGMPQLVRHFGTAMRAGEIPPMLVVFPNGLDLSLWVDSKDGSVPMEAVVMDELVPHINATYRTIASREGRIVEGFSMGGYGAARLGFEHHATFGAVSILAGGPLQREFTETPRASQQARERVLRNVFGGEHAHFREQSPWVLAEENADDLRGRTRIRLVIGDQDEMLQVVRDFNSHLTSLDISPDFIELRVVGHVAPRILDALGDDVWA
jgi:enterochelin esterase-like enzyme